MATLLIWPILYDPLVTVSMGFHYIFTINSIFNPKNGDSFIAVVEINLCGENNGSYSGLSKLILPLSLWKEFQALCFDGLSFSGFQSGALVCTSFIVNNSHEASCYNICFCHCISLFVVFNAALISAAAYKYDLSCLKSTSVKWSNHHSLIEWFVYIVDNSAWCEKTSSFWQCAFEMTLVAE